MAQSSPAARTGSGNGSGSGPRPTGTSGADADSGSSGGSSTDSSKGAKSNVPIIAGAVVGVVLGLGAIGAILFYFMWRRRHAKRGNKEEATQDFNAAPDNDTGKPELDSTALAVMPSAGSPSVSSLRPVSPTRADNVSPISPAAEAYGQPLYEAPGQTNGQGRMVPGQTAATPHAAQQPMGWQSGPMHEMDGGYRGNYH